MGNARARGTYEQRKEQAQKAGRFIKRVIAPASAPFAEMPDLIGFMRARHHKPNWLIEEEARKKRNAKLRARRKARKEKKAA